MSEEWEEIKKEGRAFKHEIANQRKVRIVIGAVNILAGIILISVICLTPYARLGLIIIPIAIVMFLAYIAYACLSAGRLLRLSDYDAGIEKLRRDKEREEKIKKRNDGKL